VTTDVMERKTEQRIGAPTVAFLREQLESLDKVLASTEDESTRVEVEKIRFRTRNHLCALLLSEDQIFCSSFNESMRRLANGIAPTGLVSADEIDELLGL
jgi:uncharacterized protein YgbK (DUF1537 family)